MNMADFIAERRKEKGMTQKQLADVLGVTDKAVSKWERGNGYPDITYLEPLSAALGVTAGELLKGKAERTQTSATDEENPGDDLIVKNTLLYASSVYQARSAKIPFFFILGFFILGLTGILSTAIVDLAMNDNLTWSVIPISSIVYSWLCMAPLLFVKKHYVDMVYLSAIIFALPFLFVLHHFIGGGWFSPIAVPMFFVGIISLSLIRGVFATKLSIWNKLAVTVLLIAATEALSDFVLKDYAARVKGETLLSVIILTGISVILFLMGRNKKMNTENDREEIESKTAQ